MQPIVTLTSNFSQRDFYIAKWKGLLLSDVPSVRIVDISHQFLDDELMLSVFALKQSYIAFPPHTIHLVACNLFYTTHPELLVFEFNKHYFVMPNNGVATMLTDGLSPEAFLVPTLPDTPIHRHYLQIYTQVAMHLIEKKALNQIGTQLPVITKKILPQAHYSNNVLIGQVMYIDAYGNCVTNISEELYVQACNGRAFKLMPKESLSEGNTISRTYMEIESGKKINFFNSLGLLQISIVHSSAAKLLNYKCGSEVNIRFINS